MGFYIRVFPAYSLKGLVPVNHRVIKSVALAYARKRFLLFSCQLIGVAYNPFSAYLRKYAGLQHNLIRLALVKSGSNARIFSLAVFPYNHHIDVRGIFYGFKRTWSAL